MFFNVPFIVPGRMTKNGSIDYAGNPLGYHRATQGSRWNSATTLYEKWKEYICRCFLDQYENYLSREALSLIQLTDVDKKGRTVSRRQKIIGRSSERFYLIVVIFFKNQSRCDSDNVYKAIKDALFENDRHCCGVEEYYVGLVSRPFIYCQVMDYDYAPTLHKRSSLLVPSIEHMIEQARLTL